MGDGQNKFCRRAAHQRCLDNGSIRGERHEQRVVDTAELALLNQPPRGPKGPLGGWFCPQNSAPSSCVTGTQTSLPRYTVIVTGSSF